MTFRKKLKDWHIKEDDKCKWCNEVDSQADEAFFYNELKDRTFKCEQNALTVGGTFPTHRVAEFRASTAQQKKISLREKENY